VLWARPPKQLLSWAERRTNRIDVVVVIVVVVETVVEVVTDAVVIRLVVVVKSLLS
jgi:hypothetical protein